MATKRKYNYNGTLLNLALLGGAALLLKKRTGSLSGIGARGQAVFDKSYYTVNHAIVMDNGMYVDLDSIIYDSEAKARDFLERMEEFWGQMYPYSYKDGKNYIVFYKNPDNRAEDFIAFEIKKYDTLSK